MTDDLRHPEELLTGYVDGALTDHERGVVESHLAECARCREESSLSTRAVAALRDLRDEPVPFGVMAPVETEIRRRGDRSRSRSVSQRVVWAAGGAIAAAFIGIVAIWVLPGLGRNDTGGAAGMAAGASGTRAPAPAEGGSLGGAPVALEQRSRDFDDAALRRLATDTAAEVEAGRLPQAATTASDQAATTASDQAATDAATACVARGASIQPQDTLVRLVEAEYDGKRAYIAVYLTAPAPAKPPTSVLIWVVRADGCGFASITSKRI